MFVLGLSFTIVVPHLECVLVSIIYSIFVLHLQSRVSKCNGLTVVQQRKTFMSLRKFLRIVCAN